MNGTIQFEAGMRARVFDWRLFVDDVKTPISMTMQPATIIRRYIHKGDEVVDVKFDRDGSESKAHFTWGVEGL